MKRFIVLFALILCVKSAVFAQINYVLTSLNSNGDSTIILNLTIDTNGSALLSKNTTIKNPNSNFSTILLCDSLTMVDMQSVYHLTNNSNDKKLFFVEFDNVNNYTTIANKQSDLSVDCLCSKRGDCVAEVYQISDNRINVICSSVSCRGFCKPKVQIAGGGVISNVSNGSALLFLATSLNIL